MTSNSLTNLDNCVKSISSSNLLLESSISVLQASTDDFPRLATVLKQNKVFTVVPEIDVIQTSSYLKNKIEPQINSLLTKLDSDLEKLAKRKQALTQKSDIQKIRLDTFNRLNKIDGTEKGLSSTSLDDQIHNGEFKISGNELELQRLKFLKTKKERLKYSLSRLNLQDKKRRLSMLPM